MSVPENSNSFDVFIGTSRISTDSSQDETIVIPSSYSDYRIQPPPPAQKTRENELSQNLDVKKTNPRGISRTVRRGIKKTNRRKPRSTSNFSLEEEALLSNLIDGVKMEPPKFRKDKRSRSRLSGPSKIPSKDKGRPIVKPPKPTRHKSGSHNSGPLSLTINSQGSAMSSGSGMSLLHAKNVQNFGRQGNSDVQKMNTPRSVSGNSMSSSGSSLKRKRVHHESDIGVFQPPKKKIRRTSPQRNENHIIQPPPPRIYPFSSQKRMNAEANNQMLSAKKDVSTQYISVNSKVYWKLGVIGRGGSSKVFKCICEDSNEIVAIKRVKLVGPPHIIQSFKNEVEILKNLQNSEHIIRLYDSEVRDGELFLVMECGEVDLNNVLRRQRNQPLNLNLVRLYWEQMLAAVSAIHERRIVHGDLKPANFLLVQGAIKLIDFGIAKAIQHDNTTNIVREAQVGTLNYISPEALQVHHEEYEDEDEMDDESSHPEGRPRYKVGRSSDIWSLGCILSQMVTGHAPFAHYPMFQKIQAIVDEDVKIVVPKHVSREVANIVKMTLRRDPRKRPTIPELLNHQFLKPNVVANMMNKGNENQRNLISRRDAALLLNRNSQVLFSSKYNRREKEYFCSEMIQRVQDENLSCEEIMNIPIKDKKKNIGSDSNN